MSIHLDDIHNGNLKIQKKDEEYIYRRKGLPNSIFELLLDCRVKNIENMLNPSKHSSVADLHAPPIATVGPSNEEIFPVNTAVKGVGFIPKDEYLEEYVEKFEHLINEALESSEGPDVNRHARVQALLDFYKDADKITNKKLGTIELYGYKSWRNIQHDPRVSVLYDAVTRSDSGRPSFISFEVKGVIEVMEKESLPWRWSRNIHDIFHLRGAKKRRATTDWPVAVMHIHVLKVIDKRPGKHASKEILE